ncbi:MAG TPA: uracil-DNA glycosylase, partial [bacterium]|nr:uracil-DNA glycosylase [bacterium]
GIPFVGRAGQLLTRMIEGGMGIPRSSVYICNVCKCRPPENRTPEPEEMIACEPFLKQQLAIIRPEVIIAMGNVAVASLLRSKQGITRLRGKFVDYEGISLMPTYHPAYLLRNPALKVESWQDLQKVMSLLGIPMPERNKG